MNDAPEVVITGLTYPETVEKNTIFTTKWSIQYSVSSETTTRLFTTIENETGVIMERERDVPSILHRIWYFILRLFGIKNIRHKGKFPFTYYENQGIIEDNTYMITTGYEQNLHGNIANHKILFKKE